MNENFWFGTFPYISVGIFVLGMVLRLIKRKGKGGASGSGNRFWGGRLFHLGLMLLILIYLACIFLPGTVLAWNATESKHLMLEALYLGLALFLFVGVVGAMVNRLRGVPGTEPISPLAWLLYLAMTLLVMTALGIGMVLGGGTSWFASTLSPWVMSLFSFNPDAALIAEMPPCVKVHLVMAFMILLLIPFTRLTGLCCCPRFASRPGA